MAWLKKIDTASAIILLLLAVADISLWRSIAAPGAFFGAGAAAQTARAYFLDVGQGDSEMIVFPGNIKVMTDAGPDNKVMESLAKIMPADDAYIDLAIISHPQLDHFNGFNYILDHYRVGAFIYNGRDDDPGVAAWPGLLAKIKDKHIPLITLGAGDTIYPRGVGSGAGGGKAAGETAAADEIDMPSPNKNFDQSAELNDTGFVELIKTTTFRELLTADTGFNVENFLLRQHADVRADILKVGHHGSKYASGAAFLKAVDPRLAAIEVGAKNTYGHPGAETLQRLASSTRAAVVRTDQDGTVEAWMEDGILKVIKKK